MKAVFLITLRRVREREHLGCYHASEIAMQRVNFMTSIKWFTNCDLLKLTLTLHIHSPPPWGRRRHGGHRKLPHLLLISRILIVCNFQFSFIQLRSDIQYDNPGLVTSEGENFIYNNTMRYPQREQFIFGPQFGILILNGKHLLDARIQLPELRARVFF